MKNYISLDQLILFHNAKQYFMEENVFRNKLYNQKYWANKRKKYIKTFK